MRLDYTFDLSFNEAQAYWTKEQAFNKEELKKIYNDLNEVPFQKANTVGSSSDEVRSSRIKWVPQDSTWWWLYERMAQLATEANNEFWHFDLTRIPEQIQYTEYLATNKGHYTWHQDIGPGILSARKISVTVQLSHPDDYEGGDLQIDQGANNPVNCSRGEGTAVLFPSYMMHRVTPVTRGIRRSFVLWLGGGHYK